MSLRILKKKEHRITLPAGLDKLQIMTHLEIELSNLRTEVLNMWTLVRSQLVKARQAVSDNDRDLAHEILQTEKRINALELKIDKDCENIIALLIQWQLICDSFWQI